MKHAFLTLTFVFVLTIINAQDITLEIDPNPLVLEVGQTAKPNVKALDSEGNYLEDGQFFWQVFGASVLRYEGMVPSSGASIDSTGLIEAKIPGTYNSAVIRVDESENFTLEYFTIEVVNSSAEKIEIIDMPDRAYVGTKAPINLDVIDKNGFAMDPSKVSLVSSNSSVADIDMLGNIHFKNKGKTTVSASSGGVQSEIIITVVDNPVSSVSMTSDISEARTGDVVTFSTSAYDKKGNAIRDIPILYSFTGSTPEKGTGASGLITPEGKFVAEESGVYTIVASAGSSSATQTLVVEPRSVESEITQIGVGKVNTKSTSDLWVWEGVDGKDYAVTGTHSADGKAYFWDVTNPGSIQLIDSVQVDARTVNDVKVSADGKICIISREGASNRKNGIVILDVTNPSDVKELSTYTEDLTGGVHNLFIYEDHVYALSNGQRYEIINISDPSEPYKVSRFEISNDARSIHDVWIENGIAYSSNWNDGIILVDVGNGVAGGSPENPVEIMRSKVEGDANHAAFPYHSKSTGKSYVIAGDEIFPRDFMNVDVIIPSGYLHILDVTDPNNPKEVARYEVPEAGSHNIWIEGDLLYVGYYNAGLRVVDLSGELLGDLYKQGREVGHFLPLAKDGHVANAAMTWGAQPHKGHVFFSDYNSGLWAVKVEPTKPKDTKIETR